MIERSQYAMNVLGNALWIDSLTGRFIKVFSKAYLIDYFGKYGFLYRNQKYQIVDIQDKIVFSDVQMAYPISVNQFFVIQNKDGKRISSVFDTQQEKVVLQFPEEVDRVEKFPHYYVISGTSKYCFLINGVKLSE
jgi:hypothetical protein